MDKFKPKSTTGLAPNRTAAKHKVYYSFIKSPVPVITEKSGAGYG
jgi:hypothetical protein